MLPVAVQVGALAGIEADGDDASDEDGDADAECDAGVGVIDGVAIEAELGADAQAATSRPTTMVVAMGDGVMGIEVFS